MPSADAVVLSLTGPASHTIVREPGMGDVTIGPAVPGTPAPDVVVGVDETINWSAFDPLTVPAGYPWPRGIHYHGNDVGVFAWSQSRRIEHLRWTPAAGVALDASRARIVHLAVDLRRASLDIVLPRTGDAGGSFTVVGELSRLRPALAAGTSCPRLSFTPDTKPSRHADPLRLPRFPGLAGATSVEVTVAPLRQPFDCTSLLQFPDVRRVALRGHVTGLAALVDFSALTDLELRYCPDLSGLPALDSWPHLEAIIGWNIEEATGKRLRTEIRRLAKSTGRAWSYASATQLRRPEWFATEYGLPFSGWPGRIARTAVKAYRDAEATISRAASADEVETAIRRFVRGINALPDIDTGRRDDAGEAVVLLAADAPVEIAPDVAVSWFDAERDF